MVAVTANALLRDLASQGLQVEETHISWVFLGGDRVYKVKRPVRFAFLDYSTLEKRREACLKEVELNRRLAPEVYLGVLPILMGADGIHRLGGNLRPGETGRVVEWAVHMVRLPAERRGDRLLGEGKLSASDLQSLALRLSAFHAAGRHDAWTAGFGSREAVQRNVEENLAQGRAILEKILRPDEISRLEAGQLDFIRSHGPLFDERAAQGRVRDGHGDLRLDQMYFDGRGNAVILDCIEFSDRLRFGDVCSDVAFLAMDLALQGRDDLADAFLAAYADASGDSDLYRLVDFYAAYRACVRGKVAGYAALEPGASASARSAAEAKAAERTAAAYYRFALERLERLERPETQLAPAPLIAFGGGIGTGKSTLASALGRRLAAPVLDSDRIRKQMAGLDPLTPRRDALWEGLYSQARSEQVYGEIRRRAQAILESGHPVIVDASFRSRAHREAMREMASRSGHPFHFIACSADEAAIRERLERRANAPSVSDGRAGIADAFRRTFEPDEGVPGDTLEVDTTRPIEDCISTILQAIGGSGS